MFGDAIAVTTLVTVTILVTLTILIIMYAVGYNHGRSVAQRERDQRPDYSDEVVNLHRYRYPDGQ